MNKAKEAILKEFEKTAIPKLGNTATFYGVNNMSRYLKDFLVKALDKMEKAAKEEALEEAINLAKTLPVGPFDSTPYLEIFIKDLKTLKERNK